MTDNEKFKEVKYSEVDLAPTKEMLLIDATNGQPGILLTAHAVGDGIGIDIDLVGGVTFDLIEPFLDKALTAVRQAKENGHLSK